MTYYQLEWGEYEASGPHPSPHDYTAVVVENEWLRLTFLPELGGRLYGVTDQDDRRRAALPEPGHQAHPLGAA